MICSLFALAVRLRLLFHKGMRLNYTWRPDKDARQLEISWTRATVLRKNVRGLLIQAFVFYHDINMWTHCRADGVHAGLYVLPDALCSTSVTYLCLIAPPELGSWRSLVCPTSQLGFILLALCWNNTFCPCLDTQDLAGVRTVIVAGLAHI